MKNEDNINNPDLDKVDPSEDVDELSSREPGGTDDEEDEEDGGGKQ